jgi:hypothetical protein
VLITNITRYPLTKAAKSVMISTFADDDDDRKTWERAWMQTDHIPRPDMILLRLLLLLIESRR